jgi:hypothetical protein
MGCQGAANQLRRPVATSIILESCDAATQHVLRHALDHLHRAAMQRRQPRKRK